MRLAFRRGGREAIDKVMRTQPAAFLKLLVLLVPREMKVEHSGGVKAMTDEQLEAGIAAVEAMLARRAGDDAKVIEATPEKLATSPTPRITRKASRDMGVGMGTAP
jgi:ketopantoate hydroxymethyltransferase